MYMLRTEIRKLGGLICFLFVVLAIQAQQYTVTGGSGTPYLLENPGNRIRIYTEINAFLLYYPDFNPSKTIAFIPYNIHSCHTIAFSTISEE